MVTEQQENRSRAKFSSNAVNDMVIAGLKEMKKEKKETTRIKKI